MNEIMTILQADATLTGSLNGGADSIYINDALREDKVPYLVIDEDFVNNYHAKNSGADFVKMEWVVNCYGTDYPNAITISDRVETLLDNVSSGNLTSCKLIDRETIGGNYPRRGGEITNNQYFNIELIFQGILRR